MLGRGWECMRNSWLLKIDWHSASVAVAEMQTVWHAWDGSYFFMTNFFKDELHWLGGGFMVIANYQFCV